MSVIRFQPAPGLAAVGPKAGRKAGRYTKEQVKFILNRLIESALIEEDEETENIADLVNKTFTQAGERTLRGILSKIGGDILYELKNHSRSALDDLFATQMGIPTAQARMYVSAILNSMWKDDESGNRNDRLTIFSDLRAVGDAYAAPRPADADVRIRQLLNNVFRVPRFTISSFINEDPGLSADEQRRMLNEIGSDEHSGLADYLVSNNLLNQQDFEHIKLACLVFKQCVHETIAYMIAQTASHGPFTMSQVLDAMKRFNPTLFRNHSLQPDQVEKTIIKSCQVPLGVTVFGAPGEVYTQQQVNRLIRSILRGESIETIATNMNRSVGGITSKLLGDFLALIVSNQGAAQAVYARIKTTLRGVGMFNDAYMDQLITSSLGELWNAEGGFDARLTVFDSAQITLIRQTMIAAGLMPQPAAAA